MALAMHTSNSSLRRLLLNVIERQTIQPQEMDADFLDFCFSHMVSPAETPGIQSLCMKLAFQQCRHYPELLHEFNETLSLMQDGYAVSVTTLRKKLLKQSEKLIQQHTHGEQPPSLP
ncbi:MAG: hypothetical protein HUJ99_06505 [Bacteroidaceae bacterium]|nr:hypothetical protein [Bacteroidaceae bacterium]